MDAAVLLPSAAGQRFWGPATVIEKMVNGESNLFRIKIPDQEGSMLARSVLQITSHIERHDQVLVAGEDLRTLFILGVLQPATHTERKHVEIQIDSGAHATVKNRKLKVFSDQGELLFEYTPSEKTARVHAPANSLEMHAPEGSLSLKCDRLLHMQAEDVRIDGNSTVQIATTSGSGMPGSSVAVGNQRLQIRAPEMQATSQRGRWYIQDSRYIGEKALFRIDRMHVIVGKMETVARRVVEKATDVFRTITNSYQLKAKRKRSLVETTSHTKAATIVYKTDEDFTVKGDHINLG